MYELFLKWCFVPALAGVATGHALWPFAVLLGHVSARRYAERLIVLASLAHPGDPPAALVYCNESLYIPWPRQAWQLWRIYRHTVEWAGRDKARRHFAKLVAAREKEWGQ